MRRISFELLQREGIGANECRILDAGCGTGLFLEECRREFAPARATGLDLALDALRAARNHGLQQLLAASTAELPLRSRTFEVVVCHDVVQHLDSERGQQTFREFARVLRPGGRLVIRTAARRGWGRKRHEDSSDYRQWEPDVLRSALEREGFIIVFLSKANVLPAILTDLRGWFGARPQGDVGLSLGSRREPRWKAALLRAYWSLERTLVLRFGWRPRRGHTLFCLARSSGEG
jgi:SAM-dependent methyltransferase